MFVGGKKECTITCEGKLKGWGSDFIVVQNKRTITTYDVDGDELGTLELDQGERLSTIHDDSFTVTDENNSKTSYNKWCW